MSDSGRSFCGKFPRLLLCGSVLVRGGIPIHHVPPRGNVIGSAGLILLALRMHPHIQSQHPLPVQRKRPCLINGGIKPPPSPPSDPPVAPRPHTPTHLRRVVCAQ